MVKHNAFITIYLLFLVVESLLAGCPNSWVTFDGSCYLFSHNKKTFIEAEHFCNQNSGHLVYIESQIEQLFIYNFASIFLQGDFWIGLTDADRENVWQWTNTDEAPVFSNWYPGQPDDGLSANCAVICDACSYNWADRSCSDVYYQICELSESSSNVIVA